MERRGLDRRLAVSDLRIVSEEKLLGTDAAYRAYALHTGRRLIPGV
jgi:hypothetical protein